ncbi:MAG: 3-isopropylmalate dehydrogenase [Candidatus Gracilibacteria bacterium]|nr:3-isopropylmalate dehydrogenase [Candidatus Gracilibacteria bacterium]
MKKTIAVLAGDGIGPEVMDVTLSILKAIANKYDHSFEFNEALIGGAAYDKHQNHFPEETKNICEKSDAILFGSVGGPIEQMNQPKWHNCEKNSILGLRKAFNFHANFRPVTIFPELANICPLKKEIVDQGIDILFVRELVGGIYFGEHKTKEQDGVRYASDTMEYNEDQIKAIAHAAFQAAQKRKNQVTSVDKSNVLDCSRLWKQVVTEVSEKYPDVSLKHILVDNCAMQIIKNPSQFDVILCPNMFGDILSDAGAVLPGSLGLMPSASMNNQEFMMVEPAGGSAPDIANKDIANPIAQILSAAMMLRYAFKMPSEARDIEKAVDTVLSKNYRTGDIWSDGNIKVGTKKLGDLVCSEITTL